MRQRQANEAGNLQIVKKQCCGGDVWWLSHHNNIEYSELLILPSVITNIPSCRRAIYMNISRGVLLFYSECLFSERDALTKFCINYT